MNKENMTKSKTNRIYLILGIMVAVQLAVIIYYFQFCKQGYHSDEIWSYGYANSYYQKDICRDEKGNLLYMNEWLDTQVLRDYIVVNEGEQFQYDSIYHNQIMDLSPPFHSMVLHTICSFFPEQFSRWFSFSINIIAFIVCMIYLFKTAQLLKGDMFALCCCALYGFSMAARDTYIYLRMYAMCTAIIMIILYNLLCYLKQYEENKKLVNMNLVAACITALVGFLTHYYVVSFVGILTFFVCAYLLFKKRLKVMWVYGFSMLAMFISSVVIFPSMFQISQSHTESVGQTMDYNFEIRFRILSNFIMKKIFNIPVPMAKSGFLKIGIGYVVFAFIVILPLLFFLRNTRSMQRFLAKVRLFIKSPKRVLKYFFRRINWIYIILVLTIVCQMIVVGETSAVYRMGAMEDRYIFFCYPVVVIIGLAFLYQIGIIITRRRKISSGVVLVISVVLVGINIYNNTQYGDYLFRRHSDIDIEDCLEGKDCMFIQNEAWMLTTMVPTLISADQFVQVSFLDYEDLRQRYQEHTGNNQVVAVVDSSFLISSTEAIIAHGIEGDIGESENSIKAEKLYNKIIQFLEELEPETEMKHMTTQGIYGRRMEVYLINP